MPAPLYIDGHLDLAANVVHHQRDLTRPVPAIRRDEGRTERVLMVSLPELRKGGVGVVFGTIFVYPLAANRPAGAPPMTERQRALCYETPDEAHRLGARQLAIYEQWDEAGEVRLLRSRDALDAHVDAWRASDPDDPDRPVGVVLLMEGADPIRTPDELSWWTERGVRMIGPAWQGTRYAAGTGAPGPLTPMGRELVQAMIEADVPLDVSHLAEESFWDAMDLAPERVLASHSNARALVPGDRQLTDAMIEAVAARGGVVGLVLGNAFLVPDNGDNAKPTALADVRRHAEHVAGLVGWDRVALGSDFDGGFGVDETPREVARAADFAKLGAIAPDAHRDDVLGGTWLRFLRERVFG